ncbi:PQQ-binding-like beta-propeller repeat protein [Streptomyces coeruleorubidus]|uniref:outer membrane protein assembly factor BamB family protein n=1 Tax=Streptomyces coeruleorubidus TaxID=116188 RepID=UPI001E4A44D3|nr:PQQ-binding-like beta-propeller repeat protein [Streptomyces bellus]
MRQMRWIRGAVPVSGAALVGLVLAGCAPAGDARPDKGGRTTASPVRSASASPVDGPWRAWVSSLSAEKGPGACGATPHQVVCTTASGGFVGRSRADGTVNWAVPGSGGGKSGPLVLDSADERAFTSSERVLRAANLRRGVRAWSRQLPAGRVAVGLVAADRTVYALDAPSDGGDDTDLALGAYRASDGSPVWREELHADPDGGLAAFGSRIYTTDGTKVTARDARTGAPTATTPPGTECPRLLSGGRYLVCTGSPASASDTFPPLRRLAPATLRPLATAEDTGMKPESGLVSPKGVLVLYEDSAEDPGAGAWNAYDLERPRRLWSYPTSSQGAGLAHGRFVTFTDAYGPPKSRLISMDLRAGPEGTGAAAPRLSPPPQQAWDGERPALIVPGGDAGHVVVAARIHPALHSVPLP